MENYGYRALKFKEGSAFFRSPERGVDPFPEHRDEVKVREAYV